VNMLPSQIACNQSELIQCGLEVLDNLSGDHVRGGKIGRILQALVASQKMSRLALSRLTSSS
jgi:hypothetical protein